MAFLLALLSWPSFLFGVFLLFWCFQLGALFGFIKFWKFSGHRSDVEGVVLFLMWAFRCKAVKVGDEQLYNGRCMYLVNHRSWSDFFVDMFITGARAVPLSRRAVGMAFPAFTSSLIAIRSILLFNRGGVRDTEKFNKWIDEASAVAHATSLLVYPEGTRSLRSASLPLKRGMLRYAHTRKLPVQVVITSHKEEVISEKRHTVHFGRTMVTCCSDVLESTQFEDFEAFMAAVQALWDAQWERVHAAPREGLPELVPVFPQKTYPPSQLALQTLALGFWAAVLAWLALLSLRGVLALLAAGPVGLGAAGALGAYVAASFFVAFRPPRASRRNGTSLPAAAAAAAGKKAE